MTNSNEYVCAVCHQTFKKGWSDEEALSELAKRFPGLTTDDCELVCDSCFKEMGLADGL